MIPDQFPTQIDKQKAFILILKINQHNSKPTMFWCYSCLQHTHCPTSCSTCHSQAIQQITPTNNPKHFTPYLIQQQKQEQYFTFESLYRNAYRDLLDTVSERRLQAARSVGTNGTIRIEYVMVVDTSEEDRVRGLTEEEIDELQTKMIEKECSVCQESRPQEGFVLGCKHEFHKQCLNPWIKENGTCPTCRFNLLNP